MNARASADDQVLTSFFSGADDAGSKVAIRKSRNELRLGRGAESVELEVMSNKKRW